MKASPRKILKTFSHETNIHTNSEFIGDLTKPLNFIISGNNRVYHIHDGIAKIKNHMSISSRNDEQAMACLDKLFNTCDHPVIKVFRMNGWNHLKLGKSIIRVHEIAFVDTVKTQCSISYK